MKKIVIALLIISSALVFAFEWPVDIKKITATFGESRSDHFHSGIDIGGGEQIVYPIGPGEVVFRFDEQTSYSSVPLGLGSYLVLNHTEGLRSIYAHLKNQSIDFNKKSSFICENPYDPHHLRSITSHQILKS